MCFSVWVSLNETIDASVTRFEGKHLHRKFGIHAIATTATYNYNVEMALHGSKKLVKCWNFAFYGEFSMENFHIKLVWNRNRQTGLKDESIVELLSASTTKSKTTTKTVDGILHENCRKMMAKMINGFRALSARLFIFRFLNIFFLLYARLRFILSLFRVVLTLTFL